MKEYCDRCGNKYQRLCDRINEEVLCLCPYCGFQDSDYMTEEEIERWDGMIDAIYGNKCAG